MIGWQALGRIIRHKVLWYSRAYLLETNVGSIRARPARVPVRFRLGDANDLHALVNDVYDYDEKAKLFFQERLQQGDLFLLGEQEGRVIFYSWVMIGKMDLLYGQIISISRDRAYSYKAFTIPELRGKKVHQASKAVLKLELERREVRKLITQIDADNPASLAANQATGAQSVGYVHIFQLAGWMKCFLTPRTRAYLTQSP